MPLMYVCVTTSSVTLETEGSAGGKDIPYLDTLFGTIDYSKLLNIYKLSNQPKSSQRTDPSCYFHL
jgi:hypothetical protein